MMFLLRPGSETARRSARFDPRARLRVIAWSVLLVCLLAGPLPGGTAAQAGRVITYGESLSPAQKRELEVFFEVGADDRTFTITTADSIAAMDGIFDTRTITSAYSSTALTCRDLGDGLDVSTRNITLVPPGLYAMALVTAGIGDAKLVVAAPSSVPAQGTAALTGVFKEWDEAACASGDTNEARQRLALEELALTVRIGQSLGIADGVQQATQLVLEVQKTIVTERLTERKLIGAAISAQERAAGVKIQPELRAQLVDLMTRLAREKIDWSTFAAGWEITYSPESARITMSGDGIAIRDARATATAAANLTAAAEADMTATAEANLTATAEAVLTATAAAEWAMTATAEANVTATPTPQPTATATPTPTPAPTTPPTAAALLTVGGTVAEAGQGSISIVQDGGTSRPVPYVVHSVVTIVRDQTRVALDSLVAGDRALLTVDGPTRQVVAIVVEPAPAPAPEPVPAAATSESRDWLWLSAAGLMGMVLVKRRHDPEPFVVKRKRS